MGLWASKNDPCDDDSEITDQLHLLESGDQSDLILVCQNMVFNVHSHIISARSDILKALINELTDKRSIVIKDIGTHALEKILYYMYSGKLPIMSIESALKVYEASERYLLQGLKRKCAALIKSKLNETNVCDVLAFSNRLEETYLKDAVVTYLLRNKSFLKSEIWRRFSTHNQELANEVHLAYVKAY